MEQLLDKAKSAIQRTGFYSTAMLEWNAILPVNATWTEFKLHFTEAYDNRLRTGAGTTAQGGYHGAFNAADDDDDSLASIQASLQQSITNMHLSNNATSQATNDSISALTAKTRQLSAALLATQQQLAMFTRAAPAAAGGWPAVPAYIAPAAAAGIPPAGRGRRGGSRRGGGRGRGGGQGGPPPPVPVIIGSIPPPAGGIPATVGGFQTNKTKWHNNWNYCYSCR